MEKKLNITIEGLFNTLVFVMLFCSALDVINRFYVFVFLAAIIFAFTPSRKMNIDGTFFVLLLFSFSLVIFDDFYQGTVLNILKAFPFPLCYIMGKNIYNINSDKQKSLIVSEKRAIKSIYLIAIATFAHFVLNMLVNLESEGRDVIDFWSQEDMSATGQAGLACIMIAVAIATVFSKKGKMGKIFAIFSLAVIIAYNFILSGRTIFVLIFIAVVAAYVYRGYYTKTNIVKSIIIFIIIAMILMFLFSANFMGIKTIYENSEFYDRFFGSGNTQEIDSDMRFQYKLHFIENYSKSLFGGENIKAEVGNYAHDLYLDTYDQAGIFSLISIITYILLSIGRLYKCIKSKSISFELKIIILCVYLIVNIQFWLEPIVRGFPWLLSSYCFIDGLLSNVLDESKNVVEQKEVL